MESVFQSIFPINSVSGNARIEYLGYKLQEPEFDVQECLPRGKTYEAPLLIRCRIIFIDKTTGEENLKSAREEEVYKNNSIDFNDYITTINGIDDVYWKDSINLFKDMNELNIIFMKKQTNKNTTKRVYFGKKSNAKHTRRKYN